MTTKTENPVAVICNSIAGDTMTDKFKAVLPSHITPEKFQRAALTAIQSSPNIQKANRQSVYNACLKAAQDGLVLDGREAALVVYNVKGGGAVAQYMPMIAGILKKIRNSAQLATISAHVVYEGDVFDYELGDNEHIIHKPKLDGRGEPIAAYSIAKLKDGSIQREVMSVAEIEHTRKSSRSATKGPWSTHWSEMARKTVVRRIAKYLPQSSDLDIVMADDSFYDFGNEPKRAPTPATIQAKKARPKRLENVAAKAEPEAEAKPKAKPKAAPKAKAAPKEEPQDEPGSDEPEFDAETGEVIEGDYEDMGVPI